MRQLWLDDESGAGEGEHGAVTEAGDREGGEAPDMRSPHGRWLPGAGREPADSPPPLAVASAVILALAGIAMLHQVNGIPVALVLLGGVMGAVAFAVRRGETPLRAGRPEELGGDLRLRPVLAVTAALACVATAVMASDNRAGPVLVVVWVASMALAAAAVTGRTDGGRGFPRSIAGPDRRSLLPSRSAVAPLLILALAVVVRTLHLTTVPAEMISLHAELMLAVQRATEAAPPIVFPWGLGVLEPVPVYLWAVLAALAGGLSFTSLKLGTLIAGLATLPVVYLLGREIGGRATGLASMALAAVGSWPDLVSRIGLADGWYPPFAAATLLLLVRCLRRARSIDFVAAGLVMGLAIQTSSMARSLAVMAVVVLGAPSIPATPERRRRLLAGLGLVLVLSVVASLPTLAASEPSPEQVGPGWWFGAADGARDHDTATGLAERYGRAMVMPLWSDGPAWDQGGGMRPALDRSTAALLVLGIAWLVIGVVQRRRVSDAALLLSLPLAMLPTALAPLDPVLAPSPLRCSGAIAPVFVIAGVALAAVVQAIAHGLARPAGRLVAAACAIGFVGWSAVAGHTVVHSSFAEAWDGATWNASELGHVVRSAVALGVAPDGARVVPYPHWVDTRLVAAEAGMPGDDLAIDRETIRGAAGRPGAKLFLVHPNDRETLGVLEEALPAADVVRHPSRVAGKSFLSVMSSTAAGAP